VVFQEKNEENKTGWAAGETAVENLLSSVLEI
jgi:hypothetical protein